MQTYVEYVIYKLLIK